MPLSPAGERLAERLAAALRSELSELPYDELRLVTSPAQRCRSTLRPIAEALGRDPGEAEIRPGLLEIDYGDWDGLTADEAHERDPALRAAWEEDPYATACPGGESGGDVAARALPVVAELRAWLGADRARCAIVVAHNHVNRIVLTDLLGWPMRDYRRRLSQDPAGYSLIGFGADGVVVRRINAPADPGAAGE